MVIVKQPDILRKVKHKSELFDVLRHSCAQTHCWSVIGREVGLDLH
jgi:hypothetical protein